MPDGSEFVGEFRNGLQHGEGMLTTTDGTEIYGEWVDGQYRELSYDIGLAEEEQVAGEAAE